ncbi:class I SAM-dependent methyltransferase [Singulisphaera sp. Ch08]|uniref:Class I SAM-dependent methyltransferase n=1 Tax=Singulisphaera sp. Ch08 TaxID=3120278 RepID=A0AAU7CMA1_9BACT
MADDYRKQLYDRYVTSHVKNQIPLTLDAFRSREPYLNQVITRHFPPDRDASIMDLGCGHGALVHFAHRAGYRHAIGVDTSFEQVVEAERLGINGVVQGDVRETLRTLADDSQDAIIAFDLIEHLTKQELLTLAEEVWRTLKPGGRWIIHTPNAGSPFFGTIRYGDYTHEQAFTTSSINQVLIASRFSRVTCFEDVPIPHGLKSTIRSLAWRVIRLGLRFYVAAETGNANGHIFSQNFLVVAIK